MQRILLFLILVILPFAGKSERQKVLVFHSYHQGLEWTDNVTRGIKKAFKQEQDSVELFFEYLDRKRNLSDAYYQELKRLYELKLAGDVFDVIIVSDNDALEFVLEQRPLFHNQTPIVFCGINNFEKKLIAGHDNITGLIEKPDFSATFKLIEKYHPEINKLHIINDNKTTTAIANRASIDKVKDQFEAFTFYFWDYLLEKEITDSLKTLKSNEAVLLLTFNKDRNGKFISFRENREFIPDRIENPVYTTWRFFMGGSVIGGKMISGEDQGFRAANRAIKIINGTPADSIPVNTNSLSEYTFSYPMLQKFNISTDKLPDKSIILNEPESFYTINKRVIDIGVVSLLVSLVIIFVLSNAIVRRKKAERSLIQKQKHLEKSFRFQKLIADVVALLNSTNDFTRVTDKILQAITEYFHIGKVSLYNFNENESIVKVIGSNISSQGQGITELREADYHKLNRIVGLVRKENYFISHDLSNLTQEEYDFYRHREIGAIAIFPIRIGKKIFGMAGFAQPHHHHWKQEQIDELATIVRMIANAWERNIQMNRHLEAEKKNLKASQMIEKSSRLASVGVMASGITHEINQPLNALRVTVDSIKYWERRNSGELPEMIGNKLQTLSQGIARIDEIIKHMRNFWVAPSESDTLDEVDLNKALMNAWSLIERQIKDHGIEGSVILPDKNIMVKASFIQIEQIIINLVVNSIQALDKKTSGPKKIEIESGEEDKCAHLIVRDNATGIPGEMGEKLYDPFYSTKKGDQGTGLGLAIVKTFVDKLHGKIDYRNNEDGGVTFTISICKTDKKKQQ